MHEVVGQDTWQNTTLGAGPKGSGVVGWLITVGDEMKSEHRWGWKAGNDMQMKQRRQKMQNIGERTIRAFAGKIKWAPGGKYAQMRNKWVLMAATT